MYALPTTDFERIELNEFFSIWKFVAGEERPIFHIDTSLGTQNKYWRRFGRKAPFWQIPCEDILAVIAVVEFIKQHPSGFGGDVPTAEDHEVSAL